MTAVLCKGLKKTFGVGNAKVEALRGIDLEVNESELLMIVGPSGSGKTTLISIIAGILTPSEGQCQILGEDVHSFPDLQKTAFRGENIGFVFQSYNLIPMLTVLENVCIPLVLSNVPREEALERSAKFLENIGMGDKLTALPTQLSGGQQQRVAIARACVHNPRIIVCDEPTSALDAETGGLVMEVMKDLVLHDGGRSLIVVTHDSRIFDFADRIVRVEDGMLQAQPKG